MTSKPDITKGWGPEMYGTQLSFLDDPEINKSIALAEHITSSNIVFDITYCLRGCPFHGVYEARGDNVTIYAQQFGTAVGEPTKYLLTVKKDNPRSWNDRFHYYIADDQWDAYAKITELTGRFPLWRMSREDEYLPTTYGSQGPKC